MHSTGNHPYRQNRLRTSAVPNTEVPTHNTARSGRRWSRKKISVLLLVLLGGGIMSMRNGEGGDSAMVSAPLATEEVTAAEVEETVEEELVEEKAEVARVDCKVYPYKHYSKYLKDRLPEYKNKSLQAGIMPLKNDDALSSFLSRGAVGLVRVNSDDAMYIAEMAHGKPYLTPAAKDVLRSIARDFKQRIAGTDLAGARLRVTSLLRTSRDQHDLGRSNVNATRDADAPHTHGTSMDISYMKFVSKDGELLQLSGCQQVFLAETLAEVIHDMRKKDEMIFATRERQQACYHLTVCR